MSMRIGTSHLTDLRQTGLTAGYAPANHAMGILHFGCGAFFRAHLASYTDSALAHSGGNWRICGVNLRSHGDIDALNAQDGLCTVIERTAKGAKARVIASVGPSLAATKTPGAVLTQLANPATRIVSLTVTEKAYGIDRAAMDIDDAHPSIAHDLENPRNPIGVLGYLVEGLRLRRAANHAPPTVLCCDNLPRNGALLRCGVIGFARRIDPDLADYIAGAVAFPSTMVDRITPASTDQTRKDARALTGFDDICAVETEPFSQWVIEDNFPTGRPAWDAAGALFVQNVEPYENMKLRMLNGAHSMLAYGGFLSGHKYVRDVMNDPHLRPLIQRHLSAAAATLAPLGGIDLTEYARDLTERFANPAIAHETYQIAMDGTQKLPQRLAAPAIDARAAKRDARAFALAIALWMRYCIGTTESGARYDLRDPRSDQIAAIVAGSGQNATLLAGGLAAMDAFLPKALTADRPFMQMVETILGRLLSEGVRTTLQNEAAL